MKVDSKEPKFIAKPALKTLILKRFKTVSVFARRAKFSESMVCRICSGKRYLYSWSLVSFIELLKIHEFDYDYYFERV